MIVDDEESIILSVKAGLDNLNAGYEIIGINSGEECIDVLKKGKIPDVVLLDTMMPEMNGWVLYDILKSNASWRDSPVGFLTAKTDKISKGAGVSFGDDCIGKPFEIIHLKNRLDLILNNIKKKVIL